jgi:hypothetical protein
MSIVRLKISGPHSKSSNAPILKKDDMMLVRSLATRFVSCSSFADQIRSAFCLHRVRYTANKVFFVNPPEFPDFTVRLIPVDHEAHAPKVVWERSTAEPSTFHTQPSAVVAYDTDKYNLYGDVHKILKDISEIRFPSSTSESCKNIKMAGFMLGPCSRSIPSNFCDAYMHTKSQNKILKDCSEKQNALQGRSQDVWLVSS